MIIKHRDEDLVHTMRIYEEKRLMVLDWLLEFRFSTVSILSERINQSVATSSRFFSKLIRDGYVVAFKNINMPSARCLALSKMGASFLEESGRDTKRALTQGRKLAAYTLIIHDLSVQRIVLSRLSYYQEVVWDRNISFGKHRERPDALLRVHTDATDFWSAIEFERWRKDDKRIFHNFMLNISAFRQGLYAGVLYLFQDEVDCKHYKKLFHQSVWPTYRKLAKTKTLTRKGEFEPETFPNLRERILFRHKPIF
jgi:hypothetical protein